MKIKFVSFALFLIIIACGNKQGTREKATNKPAKDFKIKPDTLYKILNGEGILRNTFEYTNWEPFLYLKTGKLISKKEKDAIIIKSTDAKNLQIELYRFSRNSWNILDSIEIKNGLLIQFEIKLKDYNFDGFNDIYIQSTASNGYSMSRGYLIIYNPLTDKMILHPETSEFANMKPEIETKTVVSDSFIDFDTDTFPDKIRHKWISGKLRKIEKYNVPS